MPKQERLFDPGPRSEDPWKHHPDNWIKGEDVVYHASYDEALPKTDRGAGHSVDYGGSEGMHFGTKLGAYERAKQGASRDFIHTARLNGEQFTPATAGDKVKRVGYQSDKDVWTDDAANFSAVTDEAVAEGKVVPYRNQFEDEGSVSYRAHRSAVRTWSEDVRNQPNAHPALKHLAAKGYQPTLKTHEIVDYSSLRMNIAREVAAPALWDAELVTKGKTRAVGTEDEMFQKMKTAPVGTGVKRLNVVQGDLGWAEKVKSAVPTMMRKRTQAEVEAKIKKDAKRSTT